MNQGFGGVPAVGDTPQPLNSALVIATGGTIPVNQPLSRLLPAAAVTGVILTAGTYHGQEIWLVNESIAASSITFAAAATSNVAAGTGVVIAGLTKLKMLWDAGTSLWY